MQVITTYVQAFSQKKQAVVPKLHFEASVLYICRKIAGNRSDSTKTVFEDHILEPAVHRHSKIPEHLDDYAYMDARGFFTGTFLRELHLMASDAALVDISTALIAYEGLKLKIGDVEFPVQRNSLEDYVLEYMINCCCRGDIVNRDVILNWITEQTLDESTTTKSIYDKCNYINKKIENRLGRGQKLFDTSADNEIKRNY